VAARARTGNADAPADTGLVVETEPEEPQIRNPQSQPYEMDPLLEPLAGAGAPTTMRARSVKTSHLQPPQYISSDSASNEEAK